jgi:undecaprenyl-diphosphatase
MEQLNLYLFSLVNTGPGLGGTPLLLATFAANGLIYLVPLLLTACWLWRPAQRPVLLMAVGAILLALGINQLIGLAWFHPRPAMMGVGHTYLPHSLDSSFPSDHMTVLWALAAMLMLHRGLRLAGGGMLAVALVVAWARVFLGVHFPFDMAGAAVVASAAVLLVNHWQAVIRRRVLPMAEILYHWCFQWAIKRHWISA